MRASSGTAAQKAAAKAAAAAAASTTATEVTGTPPQPVATPKVFYLSCAFCRWTTRDVGIADVTSSNMIHDRCLM